MKFFRPNSLQKSNKTRNFFVFTIAISLHIVLFYFILFKTNLLSKIIPDSEPEISFDASLINEESASSKKDSISADISQAEKSGGENSSKNDLTQDEKIFDDSALEIKKSKQKKPLTEEEELEIFMTKDAKISTRQAVYDLSYLRNQKPPYPPLSTRLNEEGTATLRAFVNEKGFTEKVMISNSSGFSRLDKSALETVKKWRFVAAKKDGKIISSWIEIPIKFSLD